MVGRDLPVQKLIKETEVWYNRIETNPVKLPRIAAQANLDLTRNSQAVSGDRSPSLMRKGDLGVSSVMPMAICS